ncbi:hypothetical protein FOQG_06524 [Fusarium oxysporum f. sp. raphani 54005]|uniref:Uncharacterized protein n=8 Tax=Fusarium oxysporum TaxID=5507 RepID=W9I7F2_FUSOX|nr:hypothetical protein FOXG_19045 [Fusarium oxysporum f. sp. lycopersici 4287]EGU83392.1 hypothetical protein FOXB_06110 [Fusarium oxysporum f. sp. conglutinans Fo5176]EWY90808.1 hypothetical protein FOYG_08183 [Fusarium oxysporum NRRL 32931]EXA45011.1 hypothetical protein FOVG_06236 [Fusarium oxysporum f. sp. pisi HDV247]EXK39471.1 hypothetical protein FOMG_06760 [Fusarium oxysporum f. sp. melonis 26406]EXK90963.1 hypothetical protein FOQG_06524 [Fusarium oxysporum f. sp. raphani 54005]EXM3
MCRGENVQCKECCRLSSRIVELCIRGELMATCPETIIEGVSLEKECSHSLMNTTGTLGGPPRRNPYRGQSIGLGA